MQNLFIAKLTKNEKRLIKKIAKLQVESLKRILNNTAPGYDIPIYAQIEGIDLEGLQQESKKSLRAYQKCLDEPQAFLSLDNGNMSVCKCLLLGYLMKHKGRSKLFRKIRVIEHYDFYLN